MPNSYVYVVEAPLTGLVKIGVSANPERRAVEVEAIYGRRFGAMNLLACGYGCISDEYRLHEAVRDFEVTGEWFRADARLYRRIFAWFEREGGTATRDCCQDYGANGRMRNAKPKPCRNPDEPCGGIATRWYKPNTPSALHLCGRCGLRFKRHGSGKKLKAWDHRYGKTT